MLVAAASSSGWWDGRLTGRLAYSPRATLATVISLVDFYINFRRIKVDVNIN
jgi:hypothetical protein